VIIALQNHAFRPRLKCRKCRLERTTTCQNNIKLMFASKFVPSPFQKFPLSWH